MAEQKKVVERAPPAAEDKAPLINTKRGGGDAPLHHQWSIDPIPGKDGVTVGPLIGGTRIEVPTSGTVGTTGGFAAAQTKKK